MFSPVLISCYPLWSAMSDLCVTALLNCVKPLCHWPSSGPSQWMITATPGFLLMDGFVFCRVGCCRCFWDVSCLERRPKLGPGTWTCLPSHTLQHFQGVTTYCGHLSADPRAWLHTQDCLTHTRIQLRKVALQSLCWYLTHQLSALAFTHTHTHITPWVSKDFNNALHACAV